MSRPAPPPPPQQSATHIVLPAVPADPAEAGDDFLRPVKVAGRWVRAHWWFHPDSYDIWVPLAQYTGGKQHENGDAASSAAASSASAADELPPAADDADLFAAERADIQVKRERKTKDCVFDTSERETNPTKSVCHRYGQSWVKSV
jgi:hypothetical protein